MIFLTPYELYYVRVPSILLKFRTQPRQTPWVLLDPNTGRTLGSPYEATSAQPHQLAVSKPLLEDVDADPLLHQFLDSQDRGRRAGRFGGNSAGVTNNNNSRRPVYKYYKRYPYTG